LTYIFICSSLGDRMAVLDYFLIIFGRLNL